MRAVLKALTREINLDRKFRYALFAPGELRRKMPILSDIGGSVRSFDLRSALLVLAIAIFYFLYQLIFIVFITAGEQDTCLYSFWLPNQNWWQNPFWLVVAIVCGLSVISLFLLFEGITSSSRTKVVTGTLATAILAMWLYGLNGLWNAMLFERGEISADYWNQMGRGVIKPALLEKEYVCNPGI